MTSFTRTAAQATKPAWLVIVLCWLIVVLDGYDLIVYGTTLPWNFVMFSAGAALAALMLVITIVVSKPTTEKVEPGVLAH